VRALTPAEWVTERTAAAEELLWRKTCKQRHAYSAQEQTVQMAAPLGTVETVLPTIAESRTIVKWLPHAKFDHDAHRGFSCAGCHAKALSSTETSDLLVPGVANRKTLPRAGTRNMRNRVASNATRILFGHSRRE
jgi:hypothetical protein